jgi:hypothetical protein
MIFNVMFRGYNLPRDGGMALHIAADNEKGGANSVC